MAYKDRVTSMCSYGTNRKLSTALALIGNPSILLLVRNGVLLRGKRSRPLGWQENLDSLTKPPQAQLKGPSSCAHTWPDNRNHHRKVQIPANTHLFFEGIREWQLDSELKLFQFLWQHLPEVKIRPYMCQLNSALSCLLFLSTYLHSLARKAAVKAPKL